jgi:hypothetical protein
VQQPDRQARLLARLPVRPPARRSSWPTRSRRLTPAGLDHVFFTGSGSEAADTSLKMARAYWRAKGQASKTRLIGREKGYHGVNFGGISVGGIAANRKIFGQASRPTTCRTRSSPRTPSRAACPSTAPSWPTTARPDRAARRLEHRGRHRRALRRLGRRGAAAQGLSEAPARDLHRAQHPADLRRGHHRLRPLRRAHAADAFGVTPDIMNIAKQVTNGAQPMGAVVVQQGDLRHLHGSRRPRLHARVPARLHLRRAPGGLRRRHRRARRAAEGRHDRPRAGAGAALRERGAQPEGQQARHRHPQLRPGRRPHHCRAAGRARAPSAWTACRGRAGTGAW